VQGAQFKIVLLDLKARSKNMSGLHEVIEIKDNKERRRRGKKNRA
jgi:hypothetical protein